MHCKANTAGNQAFRCAGCGKPFTVARRPRETLWHAFVPYSAGPEGQQHALGEPVALCGACRDRMRRDGAASLPGLAAQMQRVEGLFFAVPAGVPQ